MSPWVIEAMINCVYKHKKTGQDDLFHRNVNPQVRAMLIKKMRFISAQRVHLEVLESIKTYPMVRMHMEKLVFSLCGAQFCCKLISADHAWARTLTLSCSVWSSSGSAVAWWHSFDSKMCYLFVSKSDELPGCSSTLSQLDRLLQNCSRQVLHFSSVKRASHDLEEKSEVNRTRRSTRYYGPTSIYALRS